MIGTILGAYAARQARTFKGRKQTVGGSEVGHCLKKTKYEKLGTPRDSDRAATGLTPFRGTVLENYLMFPALVAHFDERFLLAGDQQQTFRQGDLSATPDGILVDLRPDEKEAFGLPEDATALVVEFKSVDPRIRLDEAKPEHVFQVQAQMGLLRECTNHRPGHALLIYVNASDFSVREFLVAFDPAVYATAKQRARRIMTATDPNELPPEGNIAGGRECEFCPFRTACGVARTTPPDSDDGDLDPVLVAEVANLGREIIQLDALADQAATAVRGRKETLRTRLRELGVRRVSGNGISIAWSAVKARVTLDQDAIRRAGIDLSRFEKEGSSSDRLTIKQDDQ